MKGFTKKGNVDEIFQRCFLMCGQEAVALELPPEAGYTIHDGILYCEYDGWDEDTFQLWVTMLVDTFGFENEQKLLDLYETCSSLMYTYGELLSETVNI